MINNQQTESRERKRAQFANQSGSKRKMTIVMVIIFVALLGIAAYLVVSNTREQPSATAASRASGAGAGDIHVALADISDRAKFFDYRTADNKQLRFFVMKSSDGVVRAALDACDTCYHAKRGYHQDGDDMVCNNCGLKFHSALINEVKGGCNPVGLPRTIDGNQCIIKAADLESRSSYF